MNVNLLQRCWRHVVTHPKWALRWWLPTAALAAIEQSVAGAERQHGGEIRVALEASLSLQNIFAGLTSRQRARQIFAELEVWNTDARNGVLLYVCWADRAVEIIADRGLNAAVSEAEWAEVCTQMQEACSAGRYQQGICNAVQLIGQLMARQYPVPDINELTDRPALL